MAKGVRNKAKWYAKHGKHQGTKNLGLQLEKLRIKRPRPEMQDPKEFFRRKS